MKIGLLTFPSLYDSFYNKLSITKYAQRLEPSVLYVAPKKYKSVFIADNLPKKDIDLYLCSVYTRGWNEFVSFSKKVGKDKIIAGGYHPTALPFETSLYAHKVVTGYCGNIDDIIDTPKKIYGNSIFPGKFDFTSLHRNLINMSSLVQVYPDVVPSDICGSLVTSVGCPFSCQFCSTPNMSGTKMRVAPIEYVEHEIENLLKHKVTNVFIRDESFMTNPKIKEISALFKNKFRQVYSFGTGTIINRHPNIVNHLINQGWHSLNLGLEDINITYKKNTNLKYATDICRRFGMKFTLSFIVDDKNKNIEQLHKEYETLYNAFLYYRPIQVCANFLMPFPGTELWNSRKQYFTKKDFDKFDCKTPLYSKDKMITWNKRMLVALQAKYYLSETYNKFVRKFECGDTLYLRIMELMKEFELVNVPWNKLLDLEL